MKKSRHLFINCLAVLALAFTASCSDDETTPDAPIISLSEEEIAGKSGQEVEVTVDITAPGGLRTLRITKQVNLATDNTFGTNGVEIVTPPSSPTTYEHTFTYTLDPDEVDQLVSFNFMAEDANGKTSETDLTLTTEASGEQIITSNNWQFKSKQNVTSGQPVDDLAECLEDDVFSYEMDGTMSVAYGAMPCTFDGFTEYTTWTLSEDEKTFTQTYVSVFDPTQAATVETYNVTKLTKDEMVLEIFFDLSDFGLSDNEKYVYTLQSIPK